MSRGSNFKIIAVTIVKIVAKIIVRFIKMSNFIEILTRKDVSSFQVPLSATVDTRFRGGGSSVPTIQIVETLVKFSSIGVRLFGEMPVY